MTVDKKFHSAVSAQLLSFIEDADGNEILAIGKVDDDGFVYDLAIAARGDENEVPALSTYIERGDVIIHNHPSGNVKPSKADLTIASSLGNQGIGFYIIDNTVETVYVVAEPIQKKRKKLLDCDQILALLEPGGALSTVIPYYESRLSQQRMLASIVECFNTDGIVVAEAGTGVGKSLAYLLPAFFWVDENDERVVIATATINLQQQLLDNDIPLTRRLVSTNRKAVLVKGRSNYICIRRLEEKIEENVLFNEEEGELLQLRGWSKNSPTGSKSELPFYVDDGTWSSICSEADSCLGLRCPVREKCFVLRAKREAASAHILVTNHHLLFSDLSMRMSGAGFENSAVLPPFKRIIFDEAHNIEESATTFFSEAFTKYTVLKYVHRLYRERKNRKLGLLVRMEGMITKRAHLARIPPLLTKVVEQCDVLEIAASMYIGDNTTVRITGEESQPLRHQVFDPLRELQERILEVLQLLHTCIESIDERYSETTEYYEANALFRELEMICSICERFRIYSEFPNLVFWIERIRRKNGESFLRFIISPLEISSVLREAMFDRYSSIVCTSATLTVKNSFSYVTSRLGIDMLDSQRVQTGIFPSPFPYRQHVLVGIPQDAPLPDEDNYQHFVSGFIKETLTVSEGKALVLFTSYRMLEKTYEDVVPICKDCRITMLRQGSDDRAKLLHTFTTDTASVLFATSSFWEGIDAPGETLKVVIICRLPFKVPTGPIFQARVEAIEKRGGNSFFQLALPEAVMKLKQGFGRLMRRHSDRGVVLILDSRIIKKSYGKFFLQSLPETVRSIKESERLLIDIEEFLYPPMSTL